ncbi:MAG: hypothetical protein V9G98_27185 [Candidatus Competibacter sp.]|jgi:hypothetical protein
METVLAEVTVGVKLRTRRFALQLNDSEVIALGIILERPWATTVTER